MKSNIEKVEVSCRLCGSPESEVIASGREHEYANTTDDLFHVVQCRKCGLYYLNPRPAESELTTIYPKEYPAFVESTANGRPTLVTRLSEKFVNKLGYPSRIRTAIRYLPRGINTLRILDVGCGNGRVLSLFKEFFPGQVEAVGLDFDENAVRLTRERGHQAIQDTFEHVDLPEQSFDCVYSSHVIEHVADPQAFLKKIRSLLKPGGLLFCETPNIASLEALALSYLGIWGGFHFPRHWTFFSPKTIRQLGQKVGLECQAIRYYLIPIFWIWSLHALTQKWFNRSLANRLFPPLEHEANRLHLFCLTASFTLVDFLTYLLTRRTACLFAVFKNP